jgi:hypothetical protein
MATSFLAWESAFMALPPCLRRQEKARRVPD